MNCARAIRLTEKRGLLAAVSPGWALSPSARRALGRLDRVKHSPPWPEAGEGETQRACGLRILFMGIPAKPRRFALERLGLRGRRAEAIESDLRNLTRLRRSVGRPLSPGSLDARLAGVSEAALLLTYCGAPQPAPRHVTRYVTRIQQQKSPFDGHAARRFGVEGPMIGELVRAARERFLNGRPVDDSWVLRWLARRKKMG